MNISYRHHFGTAIVYFASFKCLLHGELEFDVPVKLCNYPCNFSYAQLPVDPPSVTHLNEEADLSSIRHEYFYDDLATD